MLNSTTLFILMMLPIATIITSSMIVFLVGRDDS